MISKFLQESKYLGTSKFSFSYTFRNRFFQHLIRALPSHNLWRTNVHVHSQSVNRFPSRSVRHILIDIAVVAPKTRIQEIVWKFEGINECHGVWTNFGQ